MLASLPLYLLLGALAGTLAGLLGIGGGLVIVPALLAIFASQNIPGDKLMHLALGTSLASIVITSSASIYTHHQHQAVIWQVFKQLSPGILLGAYLGGWLATELSNAILRPAFAIFEAGVAIYMLSGHKIHHYRQALGQLGHMLSGLFIGGISAIVGIGGGTLTVPYLLWQGRSIHQAIGTSAACGLPIALAASLSYVINGWASSNSYSLGYIHLPALLGIVLSSVLFAPLGAKLAHALPVQSLKKIFALLLLLLATALLFNRF